jgi:hypothetical protein
MSLTADDLRAMNRKAVVVVTATGRVISVGSLRLSEASLAEATPRLDLHFETETMRCVMRVPANRVDEMARSWSGDMYRYVLPSGEHIWLPPSDAHHKTVPPAGPVIETYPVPTVPMRPVVITPLPSDSDLADGPRTPR